VTRGDAPSGLFGEPAAAAGPGPEWRLELAGIGEALPDAAADGRSREVRVTLIDARTSRRLGATSIPWEWFVDLAKADSLVTGAITRGSFS
jgi:hypothetical protein